jgi:hypothetical protein
VGDQKVGEVIESGGWMSGRWRAGESSLCMRDEDRHGGIDPTHSHQELEVQALLVFFT